MIALMGLDAETGVFINTRADLVEAIIHGAVKRVRPWSMGTGADLMKRIAAPMVGGLVTSFIMELLVYPAI